MSIVEVTDRNCVVRTLDAAMDCSLMDTLRDGNTGIEGTCGGAMSCGTCHVYVDAEWLAQLPARTEDEQMMLDAIAEFVEIRPTSRLSCQIPMHSALAGIKVTIAPAV